MTTATPDLEDRRELAVRGMALAWWAARQPDHRAILSADGDRSYAQLNANANRLARALRRRGLRPGDGVALLCGNRPEFAEVFYGGLRAGVRLTPVNWHLTADEIGYIIGDCEARALIVDAALGPVAVAALAQAPGVSLRIAIGAELDGFTDYATALAAESGEDLTDPVLGTQMLYTSGTTGRPRGVYRSPELFAAILGQPPANLHGYREGSDDLHLAAGPLYHGGPLSFSLNAPVTFGCGVVLMRGWDSQDALELVQRHGITHTHLVPTMFHRLLQLPDEVRAGYDVSSLRCVLHGAAPCPPGLKRRMIDWLGPIVMEYYGATEASGTLVDSQTWLAHPGTVGRPAAGQIIVGDEHGRPVAPGEAGLVYLRAPAAGRFEYFNDPAKSAEAYRGDYVTLGDLGRIDNDGYLYLVDRSASLIISGGVNIYPAESEAVLLDHPAVADVAVIGVPDEEWGETVLAVVQPRAGVTAGDDLARELIDYCRERIAHFKCPRSVVFTDGLPRTPSGKIAKTQLRERFRDRAAS